MHGIAGASQAPQDLVREGTVPLSKGWYIAVGYDMQCVCMLQVGALDPLTVRQGEARKAEQLPVSPLHGLRPTPLRRLAAHCWPIRWAEFWCHLGMISS